MINLSHKQREVVERLNKLVHRRFNENILNRELSLIWGENIRVHEAEDAYWDGDWCYTFSSSSPEIGGYFDIYILKMKEQNEEFDDGLRFYITEIAYNFE